MWSIIKYFFLIYSVRTLLQIGSIDVNNADEDGWTPLHAAIHWSHKEACELLSKAGADFNIRNNNVRFLILTLLQKSNLNKASFLFARTKIFFSKTFFLTNKLNFCLNFQF